MRVLTQVPESFLQTVYSRFPEVEFTEIPFHGPLPEGVASEVLFTWTRAARNLPGLFGEPAIRWVHVLGTGVENVPLHLAGDKVVTCSRGSAAVPIAEWVLAVMLAFEKQLPEQWITEPPEELLWASLGSLRGRVLGLVGLGSIGQQVARHALGFGMEVRAVRRRRDAPPVAGVEQVPSVGEVVSDADHIVVAAPATPATHHLLDAKVLSSAKRGVHLINIARGWLVDQDALRAALDSGRVARASLDTTSPEPLPAGHWMYEHPNVRLTPHVSWSAPGALEVNVACFADNLERWQAGKSLEGIVDVGAGY